MNFELKIEKTTYKKNQFKAQLVQNDLNELNWTKVDRMHIIGPNWIEWTEWNQSGPKWTIYTEMDKIGPKWTKLDQIDQNTPLLWLKRSVLRFNF